MFLNAFIPFYPNLKIPPVPSAIFFRFLFIFGLLEVKGLSFRCFRSVLNYKWSSRGVILSMKSSLVRKVPPFISSFFLMCFLLLCTYVWMFFRPILFELILPEAILWPGPLLLLIKGLAELSLLLEASILL